MEKKITKKEMFAQIKEVVADNQDMVDFIDHEIELLNRKRNSKNGKPTAKQLKNNEIQTRVLSYMSQNPTMQYTVSDLVKALPDTETGDLYSTPKMSAIVRSLVQSEEVKREEVKGRAYFSFIA